MRFYLINNNVKNNCLDYINSIPMGKQDIFIEIKEYKNKRTIPQNSLMWNYYKFLAPVTGYSPEELHDIMKARVLGYEMINVQGKDYMTLKSTTKLTTKEMKNFIEAIEFLANWLGVQLPTPAQKGYENARY